VVKRNLTLGKKMDDNLDFDRIFSLLSKEADELQLKMMEMAMNMRKY